MEQLSDCASWRSTRTHARRATDPGTSRTRAARSHTRRSAGTRRAC
jgi:hypothetical protein